MTERIRFLAEQAIRTDAPKEKKEVAVRADLADRPRTQDAYVYYDYVRLEPWQVRDRCLLAGHVRFDAVRRVGIELPSVSPDPDGCRVRWMRGGNHGSAAFGRFLTEGLVGCRERIAAAEREWGSDPQKADTLAAYRVCCDTLELYARQCATACREAASDADDGRRAELLRLAEICDRVPTEPARDFYEAVQSYWFIFMIFADGLGRIDQYLQPYYEEGIRNGTLTKEFAEELVSELFIHIFECLGAKQTWSGNNHMVVGGYRADGSDGYCDMTELAVRLVAELPIWRPQVTFRRCRHTTREQMKFIMTMQAKRPDLIMMMNDDAMIRGFSVDGIPFVHGVEYSVSGCSEMVITGMSQMGSLEGHLNIIPTLLRAMEQACDAATFEDFYAIYEHCMEDDIDMMRRLSEHWDENRLISHGYRLFDSLATDGCIEQGLLVDEGGALYNGCTWILSGLLNAADSCGVIRKFVFDEKRLTMAELYQTVKNNWDGQEELRRAILKDGDFFGNGNEAADQLVNRVAGSYHRMMRQFRPVRGGMYMFGTLVGYELSHVVFGEVTDATPDGRKKGEAYAASVSLLSEKDHGGLTDYLTSVSRLDTKILQSSVVVNLQLNQSFLTELDKLIACMETYFAMGGVHLQLNYVSADVLRDAVAHPERYSRLRVRVTGFSGFFVTFRSGLQQELIARAEQSGF